jgi:hypothetical protein
LILNFQKDLFSDDVLAAAAAAAIQQDPFYPSLLQPTHFLYSQWLATRNTSALFGLQGKFLPCRCVDVTMVDFNSVLCELQVKFFNVLILSVNLS